MQIENFPTRINYAVGSSNYARISAKHTQMAKAALGLPQDWFYGLFDYFSDLFSIFCLITINRDQLFYF